MSEWLDQILYWIDALAILLGVLYVLGNRRARHRLLKARCADALLIELYAVHKTLKEMADSSIEMKKLSQARGQQSWQTGGFESLFQRNVYDGLVSSSNIAYFDRDIQEKLHGVYGDVKLFGMNIARVERAGVSGWEIEDGKEWMEDVPHGADEAVRVVEAFRDRNRYAGRWLRLLKALGLAYED